jgi:hypothetical protein
VAAGVTVKWSALGIFTFSTAGSAWQFNASQDQAINGVENQSASITFTLDQNATGFQYTSWAHPTFANVVQVRANGNLVGSFSIRTTDEQLFPALRFDSKAAGLNIPAGATIVLLAAGGGGTFVMTSVAGLT